MNFNLNTKDLVKYVIFIGIVYTMLKIMPSQAMLTKDLFLIILVVFGSFILVNCFYNREGFQNDSKSESEVATEEEVAVEEEITVGEETISENVSTSEAESESESESEAETESESEAETEENKNKNKRISRRDAENKEASDKDAGDKSKSSKPRYTRNTPEEDEELRDKADKNAKKVLSDNAEILKSFGDSDSSSIKDPDENNSENEGSKNKESDSDSDKKETPGKKETPDKKETLDKKETPDSDKQSPQPSPSAIADASVKKSRKNYFENKSSNPTSACSDQLIKVKNDMKNQMDNLHNKIIELSKNRNNKNEIGNKYIDSLIKDLMTYNIINTTDMANIYAKLKSGLFNVEDIIPSLEQLKSNIKLKAPNTTEPAPLGDYITTYDLPPDFYKPLGSPELSSWDNQYTILNTDKWKVPMPIPPVCINNAPCNVCPKADESSGYPASLKDWDASRKISQIPLSNSQINLTKEIQISRNKELDKVVHDKSKKSTIFPLTSESKTGNLANLTTGMNQNNYTFDKDRTLKVVSNQESKGNFTISVDSNEPRKWKGTKKVEGAEGGSAAFNKKNKK